MFDLIFGLLDTAEPVQAASLEPLAPPRIQRLLELGGQRPPEVVMGASVSHLVRLHLLLQCTGTVCGRAKSIGMSDGVCNSFVAEMVLSKLGQSVQAMSCQCVVTALSNVYSPNPWPSKQQVDIS